VLLLVDDQSAVNGQSVHSLEVPWQDDSCWHVVQDKQDGAEDEQNVVQDEQYGVENEQNVVQDEQYGVEDEQDGVEAVKAENLKVAASVQKQAAFHALELVQHAEQLRAERLHAEQQLHVG